MKTNSKELKKAVKEYNTLNKGGKYSPKYGCLMLDKESGEIWTDEFYSVGHSSHIEYDSKTIINLGKIMKEKELEINEDNVKSFIEKEF